jgi:hypothetical protein
MVGTALYPLNELARVDRDAWERERAKYKGREDVLDLRIPLLNCLWNDVLHLSPVHPTTIATELADVGLEPLRRRFFEIHPLDLDPTRTVVLLNRRASTEEPLDASQWKPFDPAAIDALSTFNDASRRYYRRCADAGTRPLLWGFLPHVLYRGHLETRTLSIVEI